MPADARSTPTAPDDLDSMPSAALRELARRGTPRTYRTGTMLIEEGSFGDLLYLLLRGRVKVFTTNARGRELIFAYHGPGEFFGEMSLDGGPRSASVVTTEATRCIIVTRQTLRDHIGRHPDFAFDLMSRIIRRARLATATARNLALLDVYGRLVQVLEAASTVDGRDGRVVAPRPTHQELAALVGSSREMVSRLLKDLQTGGYLLVEAKAFRLLRPLPAAW